MKSGFRIVNIDDDEEQYMELEDQKNKLREKDEIDIIFLPPESTLDNMISKIMENDPDVLIADYLLNEKKKIVSFTVPYNGVDVVKAYCHIRQKFPCFILTGYDDEAQYESDDVNIVYEKRFVNNEGGKFLERVLHQINKYQTTLENYKAEYKELLEKRAKDQTNIHEESRLIELDSILEKSIDHRASLPDHLRESRNIEMLTSLISKAEEILDQLKSRGRK